MALLINWFLSRTVRHAIAMERHVRRIVRAQVDILSPQAADTVRKACADLRELARGTRDKKKLAAGMDALEKTANKWLKPYPHASLRENVEVFLVAIAVAMGIRTFFLQPFKIPTGSMQPTLYGITQEPDFINDPAAKIDPDAKFPTGLQAFFESWFKGVSYYHIVARADGELRPYNPPTKFIFFNLKQTFYVGNEAYTVWFPPDNLLGRAGMVDRNGVIKDKTYKAGEDLMKVKVITGDHLFVDRVTYNFRRPWRGEVIVFETKGIPKLKERIPPQDKLFYIKRMVAMGGDNVSIGDDNHLVINGTRLDASTPHFERVYTFDLKNPRPGHYYGHANGHVYSFLAPNFPDSSTVFSVRPKHYLAMGDNTLSSSDSRDWGDLPQENVIGKSFFVYWPFTSRFGWEHLATR